MDADKREELEERLGSLKLAMQDEESGGSKAGSSVMIMDLENALQAERDARKKLETQLKEALDKVPPPLAFLQHLELVAEVHPFRQI